ncbi:MAG: HAAS signaling domain-containing protein [Micromonosporaceae bacterium]
MMTDTRTTEIDRYVEQVHAALAHLPEETRADLVEDLPTHLAEVTADTSSPLEEQLGSPQAYAAELCSSAGLPSAAPVAPGVGDLDELLRRCDRRIGGWLGYPRFLDFLAALRPTWWLLRGVAVGAAVGVVAGAALNVAARMVADGYIAVQLEFLLVAVGVLVGSCLSVRLGRARQRLSAPARMAVVTGNVLLLVLLWLGVWAMS